MWEVGSFLKDFFKFKTTIQNKLIIVKSSLTFHIPLSLFYLCNLHKHLKMNAFFDGITFFHINTLFKIIKLNTFTHFSIRRLILTLIVVLVYIVFFLIISPFFFIIDEIFFSNYKKVDIKKPIFIISNPRNGTSHLHQLISLDTQFNSILLYQTILPSVSFIKIIQLLTKLDTQIGAPLSKSFQFIIDTAFKAWEGIHKIDFTKEEEDEAFFIFSFFSPTLILICPWIDDMKYLNYLDNAPEAVQQKMRTKYINNLKRFVYVNDPNKTFLMKNVFSSGRIKFIKSCFPDAKFISIFRNPIQSIPSAISMFTSPWAVHSPEIKKDGKEVKAFAALMIGYYIYLDAFCSEKNGSETEIITYNDLINKPEEAILTIYKQFDLHASETYQSKLKLATQKAKKYQSKHHYSLSEYGLNEAEITAELDGFMQKYNFK